MTGPSAVSHAQSTATDPSHPISAKVQKWFVFSILLACFGVGADAVIAAIGPDPFTRAAVLGKGELYLVSLGMLFSAAGELMYDRTRLGPSPAWQVTLAWAALLTGSFFGVAYGLAKSGEMVPESTATTSIGAAGLALGLGLITVVVAGRKN